MVLVPCNDLHRPARDREQVVRQQREERPERAPGRIRRFRCSGGDTRCPSPAASQRAEKMALLDRNAYLADVVDARYGRRLFVAENENGVVTDDEPPVWLLTRRVSRGDSR